MGQPGCATGIARPRVLSTGEGRQQPLVIRVCLSRATFPSLIVGAFMSTMADALFDDRDGTVIAIEVSPGAKSALFPAGYNEWRKAIGCRVTAPAVDGKANKAVIGLISTTIGVPASAVSIVSGLTSSQKTGEDRRCHQGAACRAVFVRSTVRNKPGDPVLIQTGHG